MKCTKKLYFIIILLSALLVWRECIHAKRHQHLVSYYNDEIEEILRAYDELAESK